MVKYSKKEFYTTLIASLFFTVFLSARHAGFMLGIFATPLLIWFLHGIYVAITKPALRKWRLVRMAVWVYQYD